MTENVELGLDGQPLTDEEMITKRKYNNFEAYKYPEVNPISLKVPDAQDSSKKIRLFNYRYPSATSESKGTV